LAVTSARFSCMVKDLWIATREALAERYEIFFPILASEARKRKYLGANGVNNSRNELRSKAMEEIILHLLGF
jgi:hypothetical protein